MRDVELVVRYFAFRTDLKEYRGNLKKFLDDACDKLNKAWASDETAIRGHADQLEQSIAAAVKIFGVKDVFRKWDGVHFESRFNRAVFDVVARSLSYPGVRQAAMAQRIDVVRAFKSVCADEDFRSAIESTTKSKGAVRNRFNKWFRALGTTIGKRIPITLPEE